MVHSELKNGGKKKVTNRQHIPGDSIKVRIIAAEKSEKVGKRRAHFPKRITSGGSLRYTTAIPQKRNFNFHLLRRTRFN